MNETFKEIVQKAKEVLKLPSLSFHKDFTKGKVIERKANGITLIY